METNMTVNPGLTKIVGILGILGVTQVVASGSLY